jgi:hypothetical protein
MDREQRKATLLVHNVFIHGLCQCDKFNNVYFIFLPASTTTINLLTLKLLQCLRETIEQLSTNISMRSTQSKREELQEGKDRWLQLKTKIRLLKILIIIMV